MVRRGDGGGNEEIGLNALSGIGGVQTDGDLRGRRSRGTS